MVLARKNEGSYYTGDFFLCVLWASTALRRYYTDVFFLSGMGFSATERERERALFIGTQFSNLYTAVDTDRPTGRQTDRHSHKPLRR